MSFYEMFDDLNSIDINNILENTTSKDIKHILLKDEINKIDFLKLLSKNATKHLEEIAQKANYLTKLNFGNTILIFTPMYLANYCASRCVYCGYNVDNKFKRIQMNLEEVEQEAKILSEKGFSNILILTGDAKSVSTVEYIGQCTEVLKKYFSSIAIEVYAMTYEEYKYIYEKGVDSFCLYQETYDEELYDKLHKKGPKKDFRFRLDAPQRACETGFRSCNIGALLGLGDWQKDMFFAANHAKYLFDNYPEVDISLSLPRIKECASDFTSISVVSDKNLVQCILALRLFLPKCGITISTREEQNLRDNLIGLGVTKMSADVSTKVGGHSNKELDKVGQFEISDNRSLDEMIETIRAKNYQIIFKDWQRA